MKISDGSNDVSFALLYIAPAQGTRRAEAQIKCGIQMTELINLFPFGVVIKKPE
jgi:hypothetical protein